MHKLLILLIKKFAIVLIMKCYSLKIYAVTRSKSLVNALFNLGISISCDHFLKLTAEIADGVCKHFEMDGIVCPSKMRYRVFTTAAVDNINYNPCSTTSNESFHGTGF